MQTELQKRIFQLQDEKYRNFHMALIPTVEAETVIGVRVPQLRALAKELAGTALADEFRQQLPHAYYEENILHALLLERLAGYEQVVAELERFLPYVDNWAVCDIMKPRALGREKKRLAEKIRAWAAEGQPLYTRRFALSMLMTHFLEKDFALWCLELAAGIVTEEYYLRMMQAWFFATALAKQWDAALPYLTEGRLERWTHNKTIQKARESYRITAAQKELLLKWKK